MVVHGRSMLAGLYYVVAMCGLSAGWTVTWRCHWPQTLARPSAASQRRRLNSDDW
jgi:hypothetical protein